ncbi:hypothetical protein D3C72_1700260 [compost metagenome]
MLATSFRCTMAPSVVVFSKMAPNCSTVCKRLCAETVAFSCWPLTDGVPPSSPADTSAFCACTAVITSAGVRLKLCSLAGSSQIRMAYCEPNRVTSPTPATRLSGSTTLAAT